jgi:GxxExxY protein
LTSPPASKNIPRNENPKPPDPLTQKIIGCAMTVHDKLGPGFLESIYHKALAIELARASIPHELQPRIQVLYDDIPIGDYIADLISSTKSSSSN